MSDSNTYGNGQPQAIGGAIGRSPEQRSILVVEDEAVTAFLSDAVRLICFQLRGMPRSSENPNLATFHSEAQKVQAVRKETPGGELEITLVSSRLFLADHFDRLVSPSF